MKKTININLGGMAFIIDENAYEVLYNYIEALKTKFSNAEERKEIVNDIEARIAEMINQKLGSRKEVVGLSEIEEIISVLGKPEDIAGESSEPDSTSSQNSAQAYQHQKVQRRLFRDPDDRKVAGVIAGLCHYFGINDPTWVRLAVVLLCFVSFGTVLLVYFLLVIVIPKAETSSEKLQMKGMPVNISTIEQEIRGAVNKAGESVNNFVRDDSVGNRIFSAVKTIFKAFFIVIAAFFIFIGSIILFAFAAALFGVTVAGNAILTQLPHFFVDNATALSLIKVGIILFIGVPIIGIIYALLRLILGRRTRSRSLKWVLFVAWWFGIALLLYGTYLGSKDFTTQTTKIEELPLIQPVDSTLYVTLTDSLGNKVDANESDEDVDFEINFNGVHINGSSLDEMEQVNIGEPHLQLMPSSNDSFYIQKLITTRGKNKGDALTNSGYVRYNLSQVDTVLQLPPYVELSTKGKYRFQTMRLRIAIPEGKYVRFGDNIDRWAATVKGDGSYDDTYFANTVWTVRNGKVVCVEGVNHFNSDKEDEIEEKLDESMREHEKKLEKVEKKLIRIEKKLKKENSEPEE